MPGVGGGAAPRVTVSATDLLVLPRMAVMVTGVFAVTVDVVTVKPAEVAPAGTFTTGWGLATRLLVDSVTDAPPAGAGPLRSSVPDTLLPPTTVGEATGTCANWTVNTGLSIVGDPRRSAGAGTVRPFFSAGGITPIISCSTTPNSRVYCLRI